jgi:hypothetical protein
MYYLLYLDMVKAKYTFALSTLDGMFPYGTRPDIILCGYSAFASVSSLGYCVFHIIINYNGLYGK